MSYKPKDEDINRMLDTAMNWGRMLGLQDVANDRPKMTGAQKWHWLVAGLVSGWGSLLLFLHLTGRLT